MDGRRGQYLIEGEERRGVRENPLFASARNCLQVLLLGWEGEAGEFDHAKGAGGGGYQERERRGGGK